MNMRVFKEFLKLLGKGTLFVIITIGAILGLTFAAIEVFGKEWGSFLGILSFWLFLALYATWDYAKTKVRLLQADEQQLIDTIASQTGSQ